MTQILHGTSAESTDLPPERVELDGRRGVVSRLAAPRPAADLEPTSVKVPAGTVDGRIDALYQQAAYLDAYSRHTDLRVAENPQEAIGGLWEEVGQLQFDFLCGRGLKREHSLFDIGCGTLRGGRHFIRYLNSHGYTGLDISPAAIESAAALVQREQLTHKLPRLIVSQRQDLTFHEVAGQQFDWLLAQSVFTHLPAHNIEECLANIGRVMHRGSRFFFTYYRSTAHQQVSVKTFSYPVDFFQQLAVRCQLQLTDYSCEYPHPRGQLMMELRPMQDRR